MNIALLVHRLIRCVRRVHLVPGSIHERELPICASLDPLLLFVEVTEMPDADLGLTLMHRPALADKHALCCGATVPEVIDFASTL